MSLKEKAHSAIIWTIGGYGVTQALRLGGNLILTRLLIPEFFGTVAIAQVFILGLGLFSDIGLGPGIIRSKRAEDPVFLNTAWTLQVTRGVVLWILTIAIAFPIAGIYQNPILAKVIPIIGLTFVISSFSSTSIYTLNKRLYLGKITVMELVSQLLGLLCMVLLAYKYRNIWALIAGGLVTEMVKVVWSHFLEQERWDRFALDITSVRELIAFGKWIFISTALMFLSTQADRLLLGKLFPLSLFGVYNIAFFIAELPKQILNRLSGKVVFPLMTHFAQLPRHEFRHNILRKRNHLLAPLALLIALLACFGDTIIMMLYDARYHQAGWMLPLLALGMWPYVLCVSIDSCFYAIGEPRIPALGSLCKFLYVVFCVPLMFHLFGVFGGVLAVALNDLPSYVIIGLGLKKEGLECFSQDILYTLLLVGLIAFFLGLRLLFGMGMPARVFLEN